MPAAPPGNPGPEAPPAPGLDAGADVGAAPPLEAMLAPGIDLTALFTALEAEGFVIQPPPMPEAPGLGGPPPEDPRMAAVQGAMKTHGYEEPQQGL